MKTCTKCAARQPLRLFPLINGPHSHSRGYLRDKVDDIDLAAMGVAA